MAIDYIGLEGGWGTCDDCTGRIRMVEITPGFYWPKVLRHDDTCPVLREACS
ncbi:hypothetical protein [Agromyces aureus]|uniref:hypothetical protein n=1 Tax=Agromyces aureus TaxID=453304 RepID=UPI000AC465BC|nr:hypothetical protein [Agromyces aureus]